jgi:tetratricopeptide (TPR) repeat protein
VTKKNRHSIIRIRFQKMAPAFCMVVLALGTLRPPAVEASETYLTYLSGLIEERAGHNAKALEKYQEVVKKDPQAIEVYRDIAQVNLRIGQADAALRAAERVRDLAPKDPASFIFLGNVRVAQGNLAKAAEAYEQALQLDPRNLQALENLANYYAILEPQKAISYYQRYSAIDPNEGEIYFQLGLLYQKLTDMKKAEASYQKSIEVEPQQVAPHLALAELYEVQMSTPSAINQYSAALAIEPHNIVVFMRLGHLYYETKQWDEAYGEFQNARSLEPKDASVYYWLARVCEERRQWTEAATHAKKAYDLSKDFQFLPLTAYYLTLNRQVPEAVKWLEKARRLEPDNQNVLLFLGMDYLDLNKLKKAREILVHGVARYPDDPQLRFQLGMAEDRLGHYDDAQLQFQSVLSVDPKNAAAMNYLGYSWAERGIKLEEAEKLLRQAVALEPASGAYLDSLGWVRFKRGDSREAITFLQQAAALTPDALIFEHLGDVCAAGNDLVHASDAWSKAAALDPQNTSVKRKLNDSASRMIAAADPKKSLKKAEGNLRQTSDLHSVVRVSGTWKYHPLEVGAHFSYQRPDEIALAVDTPAGAQGPSVRVNAANEVQVAPAAYAERVKGLPLGTLGMLPRFFSGALTASFDQPEVQISTSAAGIHYVNAAHDEAWIDPQRGVVTRYQQQNPNGGRDDFQITAYQFVEGLWLPETIRVRNDAQRWGADLHFSHWAINESTAASVSQSAPAR